MRELPKGKVEFDDPLFRKGATEAGLRKMEESIRAANEAPLRARISELERWVVELEGREAEARSTMTEILGTLDKAIERFDRAQVRGPLRVGALEARALARGFISGDHPPSAQAILRLVEAVGKLRACGAPEVEEDLHDLLYEQAPEIYSAVIDILSNYVGLMTARAGRGEGE